MLHAMYIDARPTLSYDALLAHAIILQRLHYAQQLPLTGRSLRATIHGRVRGTFPFTIYLHMQAGKVKEMISDYQKAERAAAATKIPPRAAERNE